MSDKPQPVLPALLRSTALLLIYFLGGVLFKKSLLLFGQVTLFWPLAGLALSAILLLGYRFTPIITLGAFIFYWLAACRSVGSWSSPRWATPSSPPAW